LTGNTHKAPGDGLVYRDLGSSLTPADWPEHDLRIALIREAVETPDADRTDATWTALETASPRIVGRAASC
jgi:hypothetical protein